MSISLFVRALRSVRYAPIIWPRFAIVVFRGMARVIALVFRKFAGSQLNKSGLLENPKPIARQTSA